MVFTNEREVDTMNDSMKIRRRRHGTELKAQVLNECVQPDVASLCPYNVLAAV